MPEIEAKPVPPVIAFSDIYGKVLQKFEATIIFHIGKITMICHLGLAGTDIYVTAQFCSRPPALEDLDFSMSKTSNWSNCDQKEIVCDML